jgi:hypothetical protein
MGIRQERHFAGVLYCLAELGLVLGAGARDAPRPYLAPLGKEAAQHAHVFVVDVGDLFLAEVAVFPLLLPGIRRGLFSFFA